EDHVDVVAAYVGYDDGRMVYVGQVGVLGTSPDSDIVVPPDATLVVQSIRDAGPKRTETFYFIMADGSRTADESRPTDFDPPSRPWYEEAIAARGPIMTEPYAFAFAGTPGVSIATPIGGARRGVIAFDFTLGKLSRIAAQHKITPGSIV